LWLFAELATTGPAGVVKHRVWSLLARKAMREKLLIAVTFDPARGRAA